VSVQLLYFDVNEERVITVTFDAAHQDNLHSCMVDDVLTVSYSEHPHVVSIVYSCTVMFCVIITSLSLALLRTVINPLKCCLYQ